MSDTSDEFRSQQPDYFPYDLSFIPFAKQNAERYIETRNNHEHDRNIVVGGDIMKYF